MKFEFSILTQFNYTLRDNIGRSVFFLFDLGRQNDSFLAFLDIQPLVQGHTLVIPKKEIDYIFDLDDSTLKEMMVFSKNH